MASFKPHWVPCMEWKRKIGGWGGRGGGIGDGEGGGG